MNSRLTLILVIAVLLAAAAGAGTILGSGLGRGLPAQVAPLQVATGSFPIAFQGVLKGANGGPLKDGTRVVTFSIYATAEGIKPFWQEVQKVTITDGLFSTLLGRSTPITAKTFAGVPETYLGLTVEGDTEMSPRMRLATVPYALNAENLGGLTAASFLTATDLTTRVRNTGDTMTGRLSIDPTGLNNNSLKVIGNRSGGNHLSPIAHFSNQSNQGDANPTVSITNGNAGATFPNGVLSLTNYGNGFITRYFKGFTPVASIDTSGNIDTRGDVSMDGRITIASGSPGAGKVLTSDANGLASWQEPAAPTTADSLSLFFGQDYSVLFPDVIDNSTIIEIDGIPIQNSENIVVIAGPGIEIERIPGFDATGPKDSWGPSLEYPFIFEYKGPAEAELQDWLDDFATIGLRRNLAVPIRLLDGQRIGSWTFFDWGLTKIEPGSDGRKRYTLQAARQPDAELQFERDCCNSGFSPGAFASRNPATDDQWVEIDGVTGAFPAIEIDADNRTMTLTFDTQVEGEGIYDWVKDVATFRFQTADKSMSIVEVDPNIVGGVGGLKEISRMNYFNLIPIKYEQFTGFGQYEKLKERITISYDYSQEG
jgi:hypothetical protein